MQAELQPPLMRLRQLMLPSPPGQQGRRRPISSEPMRHLQRLPLAVAVSIVTPAAAL